MTNWYNLGIHLGIESSVLKRIERDCSGDTERCKTEALDFWLQNDSKPTWNKLAHAVEDMGGHAKVVVTLRANHEGLLSRFKWLYKVRVYGSLCLSSYRCLTDM